MMIPSKLTARLEVVITALFVLGLLTLAGICLLQPLYDPDLWWHLKTGELIAQSKALLSADPFNYTGDLTQVSARERTILDGYWLWEVTAFGLQSALGLTGIRLLCLATLLGMVAAVGFSFRRSGVHPAIALPLAAASLTLMQKFFVLERPSLWTFFFTALLIGFFVATRRGERPTPWLYPLMAVWGNIHGGVVVGGILLGLFAAGSLWDLRHDAGRRWAVVRWCLLGLLFSHLNPNGTAFYTGLFATLDSGMVTRVQEYRSSFAIFSQSKIIAVVWGLALAHVWGLLRCRGPWPVADWLVSMFLLAISLAYMRNVAFVAVSLLPMTGYLLETGATVPAGPIFRKLRLPAFALLAGLFLLYSLTVVREVVELKRDGWWGGEIHRFYPEQLADFMQEVQLKGNILNNFTWGGYLIWRLSPQYQFFSDTRAIDEQVFFDYNKITDGSFAIVNGEYEYEFLLSKYEIDVVVMNTEVDNTGINLLLKLLLTKADWQPIYQDWQSFILVRSNGQSAYLLDQYRIDKQLFLQKMLSIFDDSIRKNPRNHKRYLGRGELLGYIGRYEEAERDFAMVRQLDPGNPYLPAKRRQMEKLREMEKLRGQGSQN